MLFCCFIIAQSATEKLINFPFRIGENKKRKKRKRKQKCFYRWNVLFLVNVFQLSGGFSLNAIGIIHGK